MFDTLLFDKRASGYSSKIGSLFIFNTVIGTGALTLPYAFAKAGWLISSCLLAVIAFMGFITITFMIEAMATLNAIDQWNLIQRKQGPQKMSINTVEKEIQNITLSYDLDESSKEKLFTLNGNHMEIADITRQLFSPAGHFVFLICFTLYLIGDLTVYTSAISYSLVYVICEPLEMLSNGTNESNLCFSDGYTTRTSIYNTCLIVYLLVSLPFAFLNIEKTKYLQVITTFTRVGAFLVMMILGVKRMFNENVPHGSTDVLNASGVPFVFGICIYSFMCHHCLPSLISPIKNQSNVILTIRNIYCIVYAIYFTLSVSGTFAFPQPSQLYTGNFAPLENSPIYMKFLGYSLLLFPVLTISTSFPVVFMVLRNNLQKILLPSTGYWYMRQIVIPLLAPVIPTVIAMSVTSLNTLISIMGSYGCTVMQYFIPIIAVILVRNNTPFPLKSTHSSFKSPFRSTIWIALVLTWAIIVFIFLSVYLMFK